MVCMMDTITVAVGWWMGMGGVHRGRAARDGVTHFMECRTLDQGLFVIAPNHLGKLLGFLVRVAVLLETLDAVLYLGATQPSQKEA